MKMRIVGAITAVAIGIGVALHSSRISSHTFSLQAQQPYSAAHAGTGKTFSAPRFDKWQIMGPGGGGALYAAAISPHDPQLRLLTCDMGGSYITHDGGATWRQFDLHRKQQFAFDPNDPKVIYAFGGRFVFRSRDTGDTWEAVYPDPATITDAAYITENSGFISYGRGGPGDDVGAFTPDPKLPNVWYAAFHRTAKVTHDAGKSWSVLGALRNPMAVFVDPSSPPDNRRVYYIEHDGVTTVENGKTVAHPPIHYANKGVWIDRPEQVTASFSSGRAVVYVAVEHRGDQGGLLYTEDGGETWKQADASILTSVNLTYPPNYTAIAVPATNPAEIYLSYGRLLPTSEPKHSFFGVANTKDQGAHWSFPWKQESAPAANIHDGWITDWLSADWGENPQSLAAYAKDPRTLLGGDLGRCLHSTDGGKDWQQCYTHKLDDGSYTTTGINTTTAYGVHYDPFDSNRLYITYTDIGLFRSDNGGDGWVRSMQGVPVQWKNTAYWIDFDPAVKGRAWMAVSSMHDLPWGTSVHFLGRGKGGIMFTNNGGRSWQGTGELPRAPYTHVLVDPSGDPTARVIYTTGFGQGVFKSEDGGRTWQPRNDGLPPTPFAWRMTRASDATLYVVLTRKKDDPNPSENWGGVYKSTDAAAHWTKLSTPSGMSFPLTLTVSPDNPKKLWIAAWGRHDVTGGARDGGVFVSIDGGLTWKNTLTQDQHVYDVAVDPKNTHIVYASGWQGSVWRSEDGGESWKRLKGYTFHAAHRVFPDRNDPSKIFVTTFGSSVWHGPATGDPNAVEDITTPQLRYDRVFAAKPHG